MPLAATGQPGGSSFNVFAQELAVDPMEIGFAYGGVDPGTLHAKGQLHEAHRCTYSVGRAGTYWLHVRLRSQALPLPGSPFALLVKPDRPHAQSTRLPASALQGLAPGVYTMPAYMPYGYQQAQYGYQYAYAPQYMQQGGQMYAYPPMYVQQVGPQAPQAPQAPP